MASSGDFSNLDISVLAGANETHVMQEKKKQWQILIVWWGSARAVAICNKLLGDHTQIIFGVERVQRHVNVALHNVCTSIDSARFALRLT